MNYVQLAKQQRSARSTVAEALAVLRDHTHFISSDRATIVVGGMRLFSAQVVGLPQLRFDNGDGTILIVALPTATQFRGVPDGMIKTGPFDIRELNQATVFGDGEVFLSDGRRLRGVEVIRTDLLNE